MNIVKVTELNPQLEMEVFDILEEAELASRWLSGSELFVKFDSQGGVQGVACANEFGKDCLIHLVAVRENSRGKGTGSALVNHVLGYFSGRCERIYILAEEAQGFFRHFGFKAVSTDMLPESITGSKEIKGFITTGTVVMLLELPHRWSMT